MRKYILLTIVLLTIFLTACAPESDGYYTVEEVQNAAEETITLSQDDLLTVKKLKSFSQSEYSGGVDVFYFSNLTIHGFDRCYVVIGASAVAITCLGD